MEPCAPGTEDDHPIMYSTLTKKEDEQERLLSQKTFLRSGKYDNVFELTYQNGVEHWYCKACECPVMGRAFQHELGRKHVKNVSSSGHYIDPTAFQKEPSPEETQERVEVAPGEPLPPGFEDAERVSLIQERLDGFKVGPLVALEYLIELQDDDPMKEPFYLCILCDKKGDPRTVLTHLASYNHISQYLQKHFPTCWRVLAPYNTKQYRRNWQTALQKIAEGIEKKFGRLKPYPIEKDKFEKNRMHYLQIVGKGKHFSETSGYTFEELVIHDELTKSGPDPALAIEEKIFESSMTNNWGSAPFIEKPFKKKSPSPPIVGAPSKKNKGNAQTNPRKQEAAFTVVKSPPRKLPKTGEETVVLQSKPAHAPSDTRRRSLSSVSSLSDVSDDDKRQSQKRSRQQLPRGSQRDGNRGGRANNDRDRHLTYGRRRSPSPRRRSPYRRRPSRSPRRRSPLRRRSPSPVQIKRRSQSPTYQAEQEKEKLRKIEEFRKLGRAIENDMFKTLKQHEKNPEKHPQYNEEWKKFWNRRYKELKVAGVDVTKHDFKPEWIEFWNKRMVEIHSDELRTRKEALRKRLALPEDINPIKFKIGIGGGSLTISPDQNTKPLPMAAQPDQDNEVIIIDDKDEEKDMKRSSSPWTDKGRKHSKRSPSPRSRRSRERSPVRKPFRRSRSRDNYSKNRSRSRDRNISKRSLSRERNDRSRLRHVSPISDISHSSRNKDSRNRDYRSSRSRSKSRISPRRSLSRERSFERKRLMRESSFERDLRGKERIRTVADLPWERDIAKSYSRNPYLPPSKMRDVTRQPVETMEDSEEEGEINVVDVLRILTALEDRLGSLGPKVIDLLAQALALEKNEANSSEQLLDNEINCVLFETVKEKLKGHVFAGLVDHKQQRAFRKAIKKLASLLHLSGQRKRQRDRLLPKKVVTDSSGVVDKAAIARQIANALIAQGKTDVTQMELEQLINAVVSMAEASKINSRPVTTAGFLTMLSGGTSDKNQGRSGLIELEKLTEPLTPSPGKNSTNMENLSDSDLQTLLQNFKDLSTEEQHNLINYLKKLEYQEPERVEKLRKFVHMDSNAREDLKEDNSKLDDDQEKPASGDSKNGKESPFADRSGAVNPDNELDDIDSGDEKANSEDEEDKKESENEKQDKKVSVDSEDEYTFEDVVKTVSKKVKDKEIENSKKVLEETMKYEKSKSDLNNAKDLISELMSNLTKSNASSSNSKSVNLLGLATPAAPNPPSGMANVDLTKLLNINMASLASIVNNVKSMTATETTEGKLNFKPSLPEKNQLKLNFDLGQPTNLGPRPGPGFDRMFPEDPSRFDRFGPGSGPDRFGPGSGPDRFGPGSGPDRFGPGLGPDRFGPGSGPNRFGPGSGPDRLGPGSGPDRFDPGVSDRFGPTHGELDRFGPDRYGGGGTDRFGPAYDRLGPGDRFGPGNLDRLPMENLDRLGGRNLDRLGPSGLDRGRSIGADRLGPGGPDNFGPMGVNRLGPGGQDRFDIGLDRIGPGGPDRLRQGSTDRLGFEGPDRLRPGGPDRLGPGGPDRLGPGGPDRLVPGGPDRLGPGGLDRFGPGAGGYGTGLGMGRQMQPNAGVTGSRIGGMGGPRLGGPIGNNNLVSLGGPNMGGSMRSTSLDNKGLGNFGPRSGGQFGGPRPSSQRLPPPDFSRPGNSLNRW